MAERPYDHILIEELANGSKTRAAARAAKVSESTVQRRRRDPDFCLRLHDRREQLRRAGEDKRLEYVFAGADVLLDLARNSDNDMARVKAAAQLLDLAPRLSAPIASPRRAPTKSEGPSTVELVRQRLADLRARDAAAGSVDESTDRPEAQK